MTEIEVPEYNTSVSFDESTSADEIKRVLSSQFPKKMGSIDMKPTQEKQFQKWYAEKSALNNINPNPDDPRHFYDYRAAFINDAEPEFIPEYNEYHWPDEYKLPGHPTYPTQGWRKALKEVGRGALGALPEAPMAAVETTLTAASIPLAFVSGLFAGGVAGVKRLIESGELDFEKMREVQAKTTDIIMYKPTTRAAETVVGAAAYPFEKYHEAIDYAAGVTTPQNRAMYHFLGDAALLWLPKVGRRVKTELGKSKIASAEKKLSEGDVDGATKDLGDAMEAEPQAASMAAVDINKVATEVAKRKKKAAPKTEAEKAKVAEPFEPLRTPAERQAKIIEEMPDPLEEKLAWAARRNQEKIRETFPSAESEPGSFEEAGKLNENLSALQMAAMEKGGENLAIAIEKADAILAEADATHKMARTAVEQGYRDYQAMKEANTKVADLLKQLKEEADPWIKEREKIAERIEKMRVEEEKKTVHEVDIEETIRSMKRAQKARDVQDIIKPILEKPREQRTPEEVESLKDSAAELSRIEKEVPKEAEAAKMARREVIEAVTGKRIPKPPKIEEPSKGKAQLIVKAKELGISPKGKSWEQLRAEVEGGKPTAAQPVSITPAIEKVILDSLREKHGRKSAREIFNKLTDEAKLKIYEKERTTYAKEEVGEEVAKEKTLDDILEEEETLGAEEIELAEERPLPAYGVNLDRWTQRVGGREDFTLLLDEIQRQGESLRPSTYLRYFSEAEGLSPLWKGMAKIFLSDERIMAILDTVATEIKVTKGDSTVGGYYTGTNRISIEVPTDAYVNNFAYVALHEAFHALTARTLQTNKAFYGEVEGLLNEARVKVGMTTGELEAIGRTWERWEKEWESKDLKDILEEELEAYQSKGNKLTLPYTEDYYGFLSPDEFIAESNTSQRMQKLIGSVKERVKETGVVRSIKDKLQSLYNKYVFRNKLEPSMLDKVMDVTDRIVIEQANGTPWGKARLEAQPKMSSRVLRAYSENVKRRWQEKGLEWLDDALYKQVTDVGRSFFNEGTNKYADWSAKMKETFGEEFEPELQYIWGRVQAEKVIGEDTRVALKQYGNPDEMVKAEMETKDGIKVPQVAISDAEAKMIASARVDLERPKLVPAFISTPIRDFFQFDTYNKTAFTQLLYYPLRAGHKLARIESQMILQNIKSVRKQLGLKIKDIYDITSYSYAKQLMKSGDTERLARLDKQWKVPEQLNPAQQRYYDMIREHYEKFYNEINNARAAAGKEPIGYIEDYVTFGINMSDALSKGKDLVLDHLAALEPYIHPKSPPLPMSKTRHMRGVREEFDLHIENIFNKYAETALNYIHTGPTIARGRELLNPFVDAKGKPYKLGDKAPRMETFISRWLDHETGGRGGFIHLAGEGARRWERRVSKLTSNIATAVLSGSLRIALIQPSAMALSYAELGRYAGVGLWNLFSPNEVAFARNKSNILRIRYNETALVDSLADIAFRHADTPGFKNKLNSIYLATKEKGMLPLTLLDSYTATATWIGAYKKAKGMKMGEKSAINYADDMVVKTQASALSIDVSPIQRSAIGKALSLFQTYTINQWNYIVRDLFGAKNPMVGRKEMFGKLTRMMFATALINSFYEDILGMSSPMPTPVRSAVRRYQETDDTLLALYDGFTEVLGYAPWASGIRYGSSYFGAVIDTVEDVGAILHDPLADKGVNYDAVMSTATKILGIPLSQQIIQARRRMKKGYQPIESILGPVGKEPESQSLLEQAIEE